MLVDPVIGSGTVRQLIQALDNRLTIDHNFQARLVVVADSGTADTDIVIPHHLGKVPVAYFWNISEAGVVYDEDRANWTITDMIVRCSVANAALVLVVF
jgi:hypothetical protein